MFQDDRALTGTPTPTYMDYARREHQPLLGYSSDEERPERARRSWRHTAAEARGRAASKMRGAAAVMNKWPDHISSSVYNYWVALIFVILIFIVMYGMIMTFSVLPNDRTRYGRGLICLPSESGTVNQKIETVTTSKQQVLCPILINYEDKYNVSSYILNLKYFKNIFPDYEYNMILIFNDSGRNLAKDNNIIAMKTLMENDISKTVEKFTNLDKGIKIDTFALSSFMNNSPLNRSWKTVSAFLLPFLVRTIAIWEGGGIVFDLQTIVEYTDHAERLKHEVLKVLNEFSLKNESNSTSYIYNKEEVRKTEPPRKHINNIQDIIEDFENHKFEIKSNDGLEDYLRGEENIISQTPLFSRTLLSVPVIQESKYTSESSKEKEIDFTSVHPENINSDMASDSKEKSISTSKPLEIDIKNETVNNEHKGTLKNNVLPYLLKVLFNTESISRNIHVDSSHNKTEANKEDILVEPVQKRAINKIDLQNDQNFDIITLIQGNGSELAPQNDRFSLPAHENHIMDSVNKFSNQLSEETTLHRSDDNINLILDINGEFIATKVSCHAFIGHIFNTIKKYPNLVSTNTLIDKTLKIFCHGKESSNCDGIKLLL